MAFPPSAGHLLGRAVAQRGFGGETPAFEKGDLAVEDRLPGGEVGLEMISIPVFVGMLELVEGIVLRIEQLPVAPHERLIEHWVFHGHPRSRDRPTAGPGSGFGEGTG